MNNNLILAVNSNHPLTNNEVKENVQLIVKKVIEFFKSTNFSNWALSRKSGLHPELPDYETSTETK